MSRIMYGTFTFHTCCFVFDRNGHRPGTVTKMYQDEVDKATEEEVHGVKVLTVKVSHHKTGLPEKASIGVSGPIVEHLHCWLEVAKKLHPSEMSQLTRAVQMCAANFNIQLPTTQEVRPNVEIRAVGLDEKKKHLVARHLSHGTATAERSYRALQGSQRAEAFNVVGEVMGIEKPGPSTGTSPDPHPQKKRKKFSADEEDAVREYFSQHIASRVPPRMSEVAEFSLPLL